MRKSSQIVEKKGRISQLMCWDNWLSICGKNKSDVHFIPKGKINFKWYKKGEHKAKEKKRKGRKKERKERKT